MLIYLMEIIHDLARPRAVAILHAIRRAAVARAGCSDRDDCARDPGQTGRKLLDVHMLTL